ncbi:MAG: DUF86 domain-containing protein [Planctomycetota bacterium]
MTPGQISERIVTARLDWIERMLSEIRALPLADRDGFLADRRNLWTAESCLRRALEALLDLGRHILAKGFGEGVAEYKQVAERSQTRGLLSVADAHLLEAMAGYRNRLVHFYHEVTPGELLDICVHQLTDVEHLANAFRTWIANHPELLDRQV